MKSYGLLLLLGLAVGLGCAGVVDQPADNVQTHIAAAKAAAGQEHKGLFIGCVRLRQSSPPQASRKVRLIVPSGMPIR